MSTGLIGIDVGGTKLMVASLRDGRLEARETVPTSASRAEALVDEIVTAAQAVRSVETAAVGVGVPSVVECATGRVKSSANRIARSGAEAGVRGAALLARHELEARKHSS